MIRPVRIITGIAVFVSMTVSCAPAVKEPSPSPSPPTDQPVAVILPLTPEPATGPVASAPASAQESEPPEPSPEERARALREPPSELHRELDAIGREIDGGRVAPSRARLSKLVETLGTTGTVDEEMTARALLGRAHDRSGARSAAAREYQKVLAIWEADPGLSSIRGSGGPRELVRIAHALTAVGEALFFQAERLRERAEALRMPPAPPSSYRPPRKRVEDMTPEEFQREMDRRAAETEKVKRHIDTAVKGWVEARKQRIEEAERAYMRIMELKPSPPPVWVVAGVSRVGRMWAEFADAFERAPMPKWMEHNPDLSRAYRDSLKGAVEPIRQRAHAAFAMCNRTAEIYRVADDNARACAEGALATRGEP